jgi:ribosome-associated heat shock protein Hsp15
MAQDTASHDTPARQRLDKWLWYARVVKSRTLAQKLVMSGNVRIDGQRILSTDFKVAPGMVLTLTVHERVKILRVCLAGTRRGPAVEAQQLYEDLTPEIPKKSPSDTVFAVAQRAPGSGRPTKKERRDTNRIHNFSDGADDE